MGKLAVRTGVLAPIARTASAADMQACSPLVRVVGKIGRIDAATGSFTEFPVPRITTYGQLTDHQPAPRSRLVGIAILSGGAAVWITEFCSSAMARIALDGTADQP